MWLQDVSSETVKELEKALQRQADEEAAALEAEYRAQWPSLWSLLGEFLGNTVLVLFVVALERRRYFRVLNQWHEAVIDRFRPPH
jgi:hypothetical protein